MHGNGAAWPATDRASHVFERRSPGPDLARVQRVPKRHSLRSVARALAALALTLALGGCTSHHAAPTAPGGPSPSPGRGAVLLDDLTAHQIFPADNWWNVDISAAPVDTGSATMIDWISGRSPASPTAVRYLHPDFGPPPYGIPYGTVPGTEPLVAPVFSPYGSQSDDGAPGRPAGYPIPTDAQSAAGWIEGGVAGGGTSGDRHLLIVDRDHGLLFETWATRWNAAQSRWEAGSGAVFDLANNARRPDGWTSADAAGLAILPGLVRYDEVAAAGAIHHAFRVTTRSTNGYVWPASHQAGSTSGAPPMGARLRLRASVVLAGYPAQVQKIFQAMKTYGLIVADNGTDMYISGTMDARWDNGVLNPAFASLSADSFEVVQLGWGGP